MERTSVFFNKEQLSTLVTHRSWGSWTLGIVNLLYGTLIRLWI